MNKTYSQLPQVAFTVLLALSLKPRHGYEIMQQVAEDSNGKIKLGPGALYASIKQLTERGLITETANQSDSRRRYYQLTGQGKKQLASELAFYQKTVELAQQRQVFTLGANHA